MRRFLAPALMLLLSSQAHAVPVTGYAIGQITDPRSTGRGSYPFVVGETVYVAYSYDLQDPVFPRAGLQVATSGGYSFNIPYAAGPSTENYVTERPDGLSLTASHRSTPAAFAYLNMTDGTPGWLQFGHVFPNDAGVNTFISTLASVPDATGFPVPEPSTWAMGIVGIGLAGAGRLWTRRPGLKI